MKKYIVYSMKKAHTSVGIIEHYTIHAKGIYLYCLLTSVVLQFLNPKKNILIK